MVKQLIRFKPVSLKDTDIKEKNIQDFLKENPDSLGLGDIKFKAAELVQSSGGRLDLLFEDEEKKRRYTVEVQLGRTDPSHIVRAIEYWDLENQLNKEYDHCAVLIAESVTNRFRNIISFFDQTVSMIAIEMQAIDSGNDYLGLIFKTVFMTNMPKSFDIKDTEAEKINYKKAKENKVAYALVERMFEIVQEVKEIKEEVSLNHRKGQIGIKLDGAGSVFVTFVERKNGIIFRPRLTRDSEEIKQSVRAQGLEIEYNPYLTCYEIPITKQDIIEKHDYLKSLITAAYNNRFFPQKKTLLKNTII